MMGQVISRFEQKGLNIVAMKMMQMTKKQAEGFYAVHRERPFFQSLTDFMSSGPAIVMILEGENVIARYRELMGATNFEEAAEGTIRKAFATDIEQNVVHGSDAPETAAFEISYFFNQLEII
jgi:nucleoside-diphosphate kinase